MKVYFYTKDTLEYKTNNNAIQGQLPGYINWIKRTYFQLSQIKNTEFEFVLTDKVPDEGIIIFHKGYFDKDRKPNARQYFICIQADHGRHKYAQMHIVQNPCQLNNFFTNRKSIGDKLFNFSGNVFIPYWILVNIIPRAPDRGIVIKNIYFFGRSVNFISGKVEKLEADLKKLGLNLIVDYNANNWSDYSAADIVLAIRDFSNSKYYYKPFSKIVNALSANTIVIAAPESSSLYFKNKYFPDLPIVNSYQDLIHTITSIANNSSFYFEKIHMYKTKMNEFNEENIVKKWVDFLTLARRKSLIWQDSYKLYYKLYYLYRSKF
jgi:hypothetical protein